MKKNIEITVAVDLSPVSLAAVRRACLLAQPGDRVRLVHVVNTDLMPQGVFLGQDVVDAFYRDVTEQAKRSLEAFVKDLDQGSATVTTEVVQGRPANRLVDASAKSDLLIVGSHAQGSFGRIVLGSVAEEVARHAAAPTLIVREEAEGRDRIGRVLVAVEAPDPSPECLALAGLLADRLGAKIEVLHVLPELPELPGIKLPGRSVMKKRLREMAPLAVEQAVAEHVPGASVKILTGDPAARIVAHARHSDVIVVGTHARGLLGRALLGSVATKVARTAPCPVAVVRPASALKGLKPRPKKG